MCQLSRIGMGPHKGLELTAYSVRCAPASGSGSGLEFGGGYSDETGHCLDKWASEMKMRREDCQHWIEARTAVAEELLRAHAAALTSERIFLPPDDACLNAVVEEVPTPRFSIGDIAGAEAVARYANRSGVAADQATPIVARALERQSRIASVAEGEYRSRSTVAAAVRRTRATFREYRPYGADELVAAAETDEQTLRHVLADLQRNGSLRKSGDTAFKPTGSLPGRG